MPDFVKSPIYIQPFNIATHILAGLSTQILMAMLAPLSLIAGIPAELSAGLAGITLYACINYYLVGQVLVLTPDVAMLAVGYVIAKLWSFPPWLVIPALAPLGLMFQAMKVPQLQQEARTDEKTGLLNSCHFKECFEEELLLAKRFNRPLAILMADLDLLRNINNTYGHLVGDIVIAGIADVIRDEIRDYDISSRFGGEEYAIVLPNKTVQIAYTVAERLRRMVAERQFYTPNVEAGIGTSISIGLASMPENGETMEALIHEADVALYQAKYRGHNQVVCAVDVPHSFRLEYGNKAGQKVREMREDEAEAIDKNGATKPEVAKDNKKPEGQSTVTSQPRPRLTDTAFSAVLQTEAVPTRPAGDIAANPDKQNSHPIFVPYLILVIFGGVAVTGWGLLMSGPLSVSTLLTFAILAVLAESLNVKMYVKSAIPGGWWK